MLSKEYKSHVTSIMPMLQAIAKGVIFTQGKRSLSPDEVISEAYLYCDSHPHLFSTIDQFQRCLISQLTMSIKWDNSRVNKQSRCNDLFDGQTIQDEEDTTESDLEIKIELERWYQDRQSQLAEYRAQEPEKTKRIVFDCYFKKGVTTGAGLGRHLGIPINKACGLVKQLKNDIVQFTDNNNKQNLT